MLYGGLFFSGGTIQMPLVCAAFKRGSFWQASFNRRTYPQTRSPRPTLQQAGRRAHSHSRRLPPHPAASEPKKKRKHIHTRLLLSPSPFPFVLVTGKRYVPLPYAPNRCTAPTGPQRRRPRQDPNASPSALSISRNFPGSENSGGA